MQGNHPRQSSSEDFEHENWLTAWLMNPLNLKYHKSCTSENMVIYLKSEFGKKVSADNFTQTKMNTKRIQKFQKQLQNQGQNKKPDHQVILEQQIEISDSQSILEQAMNEQMTALDQVRVLTNEKQNLELDNQNYQATIAHQNIRIANLVSDDANLQQQIANFQNQATDLCRMCITIQMNCAILPCFCIYFCQTCYDNYPNNPCPGCTIPMTGSRPIRIR